MYDEDLDDALDECRGLIDDYDSQLSDLEEQEYEAKMNCREELREIDEYWDRENEYIKSNGIYTKEEIRQILEQHEEIRREKKREVLDRFAFDKDSIEFDREQLEFDREQAMWDMDFAIQEHELDIADQEYERENDSRIIAARNEELAAYADFIASMDMDD